ncbi:hypothetical protein KAR26_02540 [Candidatus Parcubacteria bacterium]|nr:hypothetical protein [Candidatus Parcubacteria bacterium]
MKNIETVKDEKDNVIAIIIRDDFSSDGVQFFTPGDFNQQLGFISHKTGKIIDAHIHKIIKREIYLTQEVLFIKKGKIEVNFYDSEKKYLSSRVLTKGDIILLAGQGHGYKVLEDVEMIEVKQGPYLGKDDKVRFKGIE